MTFNRDINNYIEINSRYYTFWNRITDRSMLFVDFSLGPELICIVYDNLPCFVIIIQWLLQLRLKYISRGYML